MSRRRGRLRVAVRGGSFYFDFEPNPGGEWSAFVPESRRRAQDFAVRPTSARAESRNNGLESWV